MTTDATSRKPTETQVRHLARITFTTFLLTFIAARLL